LHPAATSVTTGQRSGAYVALLHFLENRRHPGEVVVHVEHHVAVMDRCRTHQKVDGSGGAVLRSLGEFVLRGFNPAPRVLGNRREMAEIIQLFGQLVAMGRARGRVEELRPRGLADRDSTKLLDLVRAQSEGRWPLLHCAKSLPLPGGSVDESG
jgi:hypothetical protein